MLRFQLALVILTLLPLIMALIGTFAITPKRQQSMEATLDAAARMPVEKRAVSAQQQTSVEQALDQARKKVQLEFQSLYRYRLLIPASLLSLLYFCMLSLGISALPVEAPCSTYLCQPFPSIDRHWLINPAFAALGAYVFNFGFLARRGYMADITKNAYWSAINRLIFAVGFGIALSMATTTRGWGFRGETLGFISFAIAFIPRVAVSWLRRAGTNYFGERDDAVHELSLQLVQGIDIWKVARLEEEGIESVQNLATASAVTLAAKMHYPLRTIVDWVDQAILIQRFPESAKRLPAIGVPVSAIEFAWLANSDDSPAFARIAQALGVDVDLLRMTATSLDEDLYVNVLWRLWQSMEPDE
jgi:hypothetical protein